MNAYEFNKIAGWVLSAFLFIFGVKELGAVMSHAKHDAKAGYALPVPKAGPGGVAAAAETFSFAKIAELLPKASVENGKDVFKACLTCHTPEKGGGVKQGPNLWDILGRDVGKQPGFTNYSPAMIAKGGKWDWASVANYLYDPKGYIPNNRMAYVGIKDPTDLADVLAYLRTLADAPAALPK